MQDTTTLQPQWHDQLTQHGYIENWIHKARMYPNGSDTTAVYVITENSNPALFATDDVECINQHLRFHEVPLDGWCSVSASLQSGHHWCKGSPKWEQNGLEEPES